MRNFLVAGCLVILCCAATSWGYVDATIKVYDTASGDVPGPQPIRVFPVPAAAGWSGGQLIYDNYGEGLAFSPANDPALYQYYAVPLSNSKLTINGITNNLPTTPSLDNTFNLYTSVEGLDSDPLADNRFPYHIPRLARSHAENFLSVQLELVDPVEKIGLFLPASSNTWGPLDPEHPENTFPQNFQLQDRNVYLWIQGEGDTFATAQTAKVSLMVDGSGTYCPFLEVAWNGTDLIKSISLVHDCARESADRGIGIMDVYVIPEPGTLALLAAGLGLLIRRKR